MACRLDCDKLKKLEDLEERLGISLLTYVEMIENGFYGKFKDTDDEGKEHEYISYISKDFVIGDGKITVFWENTYDECVIYNISDEGKTWSLTRKELENE